MADLFYHSYFIQGLGIIAFILGIWGMSCKKDMQLKKIMVGQCAVLAVHFFLLQASGGAVAAFITGIRNYMSLYKKLRHAAPVFIVFYIGLGYYRYEEWVDVLPIIGSMVSTIGFFYLDKIPMRLCILLTTALWGVHNFIVMSIAPFFMEVLIFVINTKTIYALYRNKNG